MSRIPSEVRPVVLITGCSSGIGREAAFRFARAGYQVFATTRRAEQGAALRQEAAARGLEVATPTMDVTDDGSVSAAVAGLLSETGGRIDVLVNNAGYYCFGPVEETAPDELRAQLETNVVGVLRVSRAVLPAMRARRRGAIVNISSVSGRVALPVVGPYHASKWALEALTESMRYELIPFGVKVTCVEPGPFATALHAKEIRVRDSMRPDSPYASLVTRYEAELHRMRRGDVEEVVETVFRAATHPHPKLRWPVGPSAFSGAVLRRFVPDALFEWVVRLVFRLRPPRD